MSEAKIFSDHTNDAFNSQVKNTVKMLGDWFQAQDISPSIGMFAMAQLIVGVCDTKDVKRMTELMLEWSEQGVQ